MNLILTLPPETEAKLREHAALTGKEPESLALEALEEKLSTDRETPRELSRTEWHKRFREWMDSMPPGNVNADISRDSIYEGRGE